MNPAKFLTALALISLTAVARASSYSSPDGNLGFNLPADGSLIQLPNPPAPATAMWITADQRSRVIFVSLANPQNTPLVQSELEEGTLKAFPGGSIQSSTQTTIGNVPVITVAGVDKTGTIYFQQVVLTFNGTIYKLIGAAPGPVAADPRMSAVFNSVAILRSVPAAPAVTPSIPAPTGQETSVRMAEFAIGILALAGIGALIRRQNNRGKPPPLP